MCQILLHILVSLGQVGRQLVSSTRLSWLGVGESATRRLVELNPQCLVIPLLYM